MNIINRRKKISEELRDKEYRDAFAIEHIDTGVPFQVKALREQREWTQQDLGRRADMAQETISRIEDPNYGKLTLNTLKRLATAFDVALMVRFVPFGELVDWELKLSPESLKAFSFDNDPYFKEETEEELVPRSLSNQWPSSNVIDFSNYLSRRQEEIEMEKMLHPLRESYTEKNIATGV